MQSPSMRFIRQERNRGFLWNKETGKTYQFDEQAYQLFSEFDAGVGIKKAATMHALSEEEIKKISENWGIMPPNKPDFLFFPL